MTQVPEISEFCAPIDAKIAADKSKLIDHCLKSVRSEPIKLALGELVIVDLPATVPQCDELIRLTIGEFIAAGWICWLGGKSLCFKRQRTPEQISLNSRELQVTDAMKAIVDYVSNYSGELAQRETLTVKVDVRSPSIFLEAVRRLSRQGWNISIFNDKIIVDVNYGDSGVRATVAR